MVCKQKITIIGGGSYGWAFGFIRQFADVENNNEYELVLNDINEEALNIVFSAGMKYIKDNKSGLILRKIMNLNKAIDSADFILVTISTGGLETMKNDLEIPEKYGVLHTVGDTVGPAGWSRAVRNIPVFYDIGERVKKYAPDAWLLNMSNPLTILTRVPNKCFGIKSVGMCPGVEEMVKTLVEMAGLDPAAAKADFTVSGIDHGSWFTKLHADGIDILEKLKEKGYYRSDDKFSSNNENNNDPFSSRAVFAVWREIGYMPSICDRHSVENWPWFLLDKKKKLGFSLQRTTIEDRKKNLQAAKKLHVDYIAGKKEMPGAGHGSDPVPEVVFALNGHKRLMWASNYPNIDQIPGLPEGAVVETRCFFDAAGVHPLVSPMPNVLKTLVLPHVLRQEMIIDIALHGSFDELVSLMTTDPLCSRIPFGKCREMTRELLEANKKYIRNPRLLEF